MSLRSARFRATLLWALTSVLAPPASAFHVELVEVVGGRNVEITASSIQSSVVLYIVNREDLRIECRLTFDTGPNDSVRRVMLEPRRTRTVNFPVRRPSTQRVRVSALCQ